MMDEADGNELERYLREVIDNAHGEVDIRRGKGDYSHLWYAGYAAALKDLQVWLQERKEPESSN